MDDIDPLPEPASLKLLRRLVTVLTVVMIVGVVVVVGLLVIRLQSPTTTLELPSEITLPEGTRPTAFTKGTDWFAITSDDAILIYNTDGTLRKRVDIKAP